MSQDLFSENKGLTYEEAMFEAQRCLNCRHKPCVEGCIAHNDIPNMILAFIEGRGEDAKAISESKTSFPEICGRVCYQEMQCEAVCVRMKQNAPVKIGLIERFIGDHYQSSVEIKKKTKHSVAIVGSGPASLACAQHLLENGVNVEIFEKNTQLGGVLVHGIPPYRLPNKVVEHRLQHLIDIGLKVHLDQKIQNQEDYELILKDQFDAIFLGIGASQVNDSKFIGSDSDKVIGWQSFLNLLNLDFEHFKHHFSQIQSVIVMGGGNVAMDVAISAAKSGIKTSIVYRRGIQQMPARKTEVQDALEHGVHIYEFTDPYEIIDLSETRIKVKAHRTELKEDPSNHKISVIATDETIELESNLLIMAIGSKVRALDFEFLNKDQNNQIVVDEFYETSLKNVFAAGDGVTGPKTVIHALAGGKMAGQNILERLKNEG